MKEFPNKINTELLETLAGEYVQLWCLNYIYAGRLSAIDEDGSFVRLENAHVVYLTGEL